ncbi:MAG: 4Fe-4S binding protein [Lachnospiraceae bacterium]|nr:4Fe-4S binding protein [Lachnospiraceae bacterium]
MTFDELYRRVLKDRLKGRGIESIGRQARKKLDCLLHPEKYPLIWKENPCDCSDAQCVTACMFQALEIQNGEVALNPDNCVGCARCVEACQNKNLTFSRDAVKAVELLKTSEEPVYALMAPAYVGQFGGAATPGRLRSALKGMGFTGMLEVAAFADILTLKESLEFCANMEKPEGFQLTSCCCPIWISMIRKEFTKIAGHLPASVSPMIAAGRIAKVLHEGCKTIFVGPCMAKKAEIREPDLEGAIDCVLTFEELQDMFEALAVDFESMEEDENEHSASAGRMYARTGGVSSAVKECVKSIEPGCEMTPVCACGPANCKKMLQRVLDGQLAGNFFEGMACEGGCVGGPKRNIEKEEGTDFVDAYASEAKYRTPGENPYVLDLIQRLGFQTVEDFLENSQILTRELSAD